MSERCRYRGDLQGCAKESDKAPGAAEMPSRSSVEKIIQPESAGAAFEKKA